MGFDERTALDRSVTPTSFVDHVCAAVESTWHAAPIALPTIPLGWSTAAAQRDGPALRLIQLCCQAAGGASEPAVPVAAAWHFLHCAAHWLDDVEEGAATAPYPPAQLINWSTAFLFAAQLTLLRAAPQLLSPGQALALSQAFATTGLHLSAVQEWELAASMQILPLDRCWQITCAKGGEPFALACQAGAMLGTDDPDVVAAYAAYGRHLGALVQISDDVRAIWQPRDRNDLLTLEHTLPVAYGHQVTSPSDQVQWSDLLHRAAEDPGALIDLQQRLAETGALHYAGLRAAEQNQLAQTALSTHDASPGMHQELLQLLNGVSSAVV